MQSITHYCRVVAAFSLTAWLGNLVANATYRATLWVVSHRCVQDGIVDAVKCGSPIGRALKGYIEDNQGGVDVDDVEGLSNAINSEIESALQNFEVDVKNINGLEEEVNEIVFNESGEIPGLDDVADRAVTEKIEEAFNDLIGEEPQEILLRHIAQRLSY